jgi:hypothetical protein
MPRNNFMSRIVSLEGVKICEGPTEGKKIREMIPVYPIKGQINVTGLKF